VLGFIALFLVCLFAGGRFLGSRILGGIIVEMLVLRWWCRDNSIMLKILVMYNSWTRPEDIFHFSYE
jgi:hypothetical protein